MVELTMEQTVALAYAADLMAREAERLQAAGMDRAAELYRTELAVIDELRAPPF